MHDDLETRKLQLAVRRSWHGSGGGAPPHLSLDALAKAQNLAAIVL